jgi:hypothetical protein
MSNNNVIKFPKIKLDTPPQTPEEVAEKLIEYRMSFSNDIAESLWNLVLMEMTRSGCNFASDTDEYYPSIILLLEAIRSLHLQASGVYHPLQDVAAEILDGEEEDEGEDEEVVDKPQESD